MQSLRVASELRMNYQSAPRVRLERNFNQSHLKRWQKYKNDMSILGGVTLGDVADFAECLLGDGLSSVGNYLSTVVQFEIHVKGMIEEPFWERRYSTVRSDV